MKKWRPWIWSVIAFALFFLASLSAAWAMPGQSTLNQSIPTRTPLPAPTARLSEPGNPLVIPGASPTDSEPGILTGAPATGAGSPQGNGALPSQLPATPQTADMPFPPSSQPDSTPAELAPAKTPVITAPGTTPESAPYGPPTTLGGLPSQENSSRDGSWLTLLFPNAKSPQASTFASLMGGALLTLGIVILFLVGQRRAK